MGQIRLMVIATHCATFINNVALLMPELVEQINRIVVTTGHRLTGVGEHDQLRVRCDSVVVETDVHYTTDLNLLWDTLHCLIREIHRLCRRYEIKCWRQHNKLTGKTKKLFNAVNQAWLWNCRPKQVAGYLEFGGRFVERAERSLSEIQKRPATRSEQIKMKEVKNYIFHTRWIYKGKAGVSVVLGGPVSIVEDQHQFLLEHRIMWQKHDVDVAAPLARQCKENYPNLVACSFDKEYYSPSNREELGQVLELNVMPKKGKANLAEI